MKKQSKKRIYARILLYVMLLEILPLENIRANSGTIPITKLSNRILQKTSVSDIHFSGYQSYAPYKDENTFHHVQSYRKYQAEQASRRAEYLKRISLSIPKTIYGGGPSMPEVHNFTPASHDKMVDPFTGSFTYNIPLFDVGGYPINLAYNSNVLANDEASWVGLGWNLNVGAVTRNVRGLPDDFMGDEIVKQQKMKAHEAMSLGIGFSGQFAGIDMLKLAFGLQAQVEYDNYSGFGLTAGTKGSVSIGSDKTGASLGLGSAQGISSRTGGYFSPSLSLSGNFSKNSTKSSLGISIGADMNSREGLKQMTYGLSYSTTGPNNLKIVNAGSSFSLGAAFPSFTPKIEIPMRSEALNFSATVGTDITIFHPAFDLKGSYSKESVLSDTLKEKGYGYLYLDQSKDESLLDINRENDGPYIKEIPNLPVTNLTYDIYSVNAQGVNGTFRPFRGDVGLVHDSYRNNPNTALSIGGELGLGQLVHGGVDVSSSSGGSSSGLWKQENALYNKLKFSDSIYKSENPLYESVYFKNIGEQTVLQNSELFEDTLGGFEPVQTELIEGDDSSLGKASNKIGSHIFDHPIRNTKREPRKTLFSYKSFQELINRNGSSLFLEYYKAPPSGSVMNEEKILEPLPNNNDGSKKLNHIGEISITEETGKRYIFGLPAYNITSEEYTFNVNTTPDQNNEVAYSSIENDFGKDEFSSTTKTSPYAYSWLLTSIVSEDYQDLANDGPTPDDLGNYTKIKYQKLLQNNKWKSTPDFKKADFHENNVHDTNDSKASFEYGEKEVFYVYKIESKTHIAVFHCSDRDDNVGVKNADGEIDRNNRLKKLDSIKLYTWEGYTNSLKTAIKSIYFNYDYSLAKGVRNTMQSGQGKLTLKKLHFQFLNSSKSKNHPYEFVYSKNPNYKKSNVDRWGYYKEQQDNRPSNFQFPYTIQNKSIQDENAKAWLLDKIYTPAGATYEIGYEAHAYRFVQNKSAMSMFKILGFGKDINHDLGGNILYENANTEIINNYMFIDPGTLVNETQLKELLKDIKFLYYKTRLNILINNSETRLYENLEGFDSISVNNYSDYNTNFGLRNDGKIWIKLFHNEGKHPISKSGIELLRSQYPDLIYSNVVRPDEDNLQNFGAALSAFIEAFKQVFSGGGEEQYLITSNRCKEVDLNYSFVRLNALNSKKYAGGARVKKITIDDNWGKMQTHIIDESLDFKYGAEYKYEDENGNSSGVTSNEPFVGNDENALLSPAFYGIVRPLVSNVVKYMLDPVGQMYYPAANIGYSRVVETPLSYKYENNRISRKSGYKVYEFYTAKDFPTISKKTSQVPVLTDINISLVLFNKATKAVVASQGFCIELNNMHGQPKSISLYDASDNKIESTTYHYKQDPNTTKLSNKVNVVNSMNGKVEEKLFGVDYDFTVDARQFRTEINSTEVQVNINTFFISIVPIPLPFFLPAKTENLSEMRSITTTKVIMRSGILTDIAYYKLGATKTVTNDFFDEVNGSPVVTSSTDDFDKKVYTISIPSYYTYKGMGPAYKNDHIIKTENCNNGRIEGTWVSRLAEGDEFILSNSNVRRAWVANAEGNRAVLIGTDGNIIHTGTLEMSLNKSGYKNNLASVFGNLVTYQYPKDRDGKLLMNPSENILSANVQTYSDYWHIDQPVQIAENTAPCKCDDFSSKNNSLGSNIKNILEISQQTAYRERINTGYQPAHVTFYNNGCEYTLSNVSGLSLPDKPFGRFQPISNSSCSDIMSGFVIGNEFLLILKSNCPFVKCSKLPDVINRNCTPTIFNPFLNGLFGRYKPLTSYSPKDLLTYTANTYSSGFLSNFKKFAEWTNGSGLRLTIDPDYYQRNDSITAINSFGNSLEVVNALNIPSSTFFGFRGVIAQGSATYAHYTDFGYDGFEDYLYKGNTSGNSMCNSSSHFDFVTKTPFASIKNQLISDFSHSGKYCLKITPRTPIYHDIKVFTTDDRTKKSERLSSDNLPFRIAQGDQIKVFNPRPGKYWISAWVRVKDINSYDYQYVILTIGGARLKPSGPIIDGWQQIKSEIEIPNRASNMSIIIGVDFELPEAYVDDIRIQPFESAVETYSIDANLLRLAAKHDAQNYSTFFEYNYEGQLSRTKKETEKGIFTIQEIKTELPIISRR